MKFKSGLNFVKKCHNVICFYVYSVMVLSIPKIIAIVTAEWMSKVHWGNDTGRGNQSIQRESCPCYTVSTTSPTRTVLGLNTALQGEKLATNSLTHGTAWLVMEDIYV
jgi:hypothetical protein